MFVAYRGIVLRRTNFSAGATIEEKFFYAKKICVYCYVALVGEIPSKSPFSGHEGTLSLYKSLKNIEDSIYSSSQTKGHCLLPQVNQQCVATNIQHVHYRTRSSSWQRSGLSLRNLG